MFEVISGEESINWNSEGKEKIAQNVLNILNTFKYEIPYFRDFGRDPKNIDLVNNKYALIEETYDLIEKYEPEAIIKDVTVLNDGNIKVVLE